MSCAAAGPWGLVGTIEEAMAAQARASVEGFLAFAVSWCERGAAAAAAVDAASDGQVGTGACARMCCFCRGKAGLHACLLRMMLLNICLASTPCLAQISALAARRSNI